MLAQPLEDADLAGARPARLPRRMEMGRHPRPARRPRRRKAALFALGRRYRRGLSRCPGGDRRRGDARRRAAGHARRRGRAVQRSAAAPQPQDADREDAARLSGGGAALRHLARGPRGSARPAVCRAPPAARSLVCAGAATGPRPVAAGAVCRAGTNCANCATAPASAASRG